MKKLIVLAILCFLGMGYAQAQAPSLKALATKTAAQDGLTELLIQKLNLSEQQVASVTKIMGAYTAARKSVNESTMSAEDKKVRLDKVNLREEQNMKNILDASQFAKYTELAKEFRKG